MKVKSIAVIGGDKRQIYTVNSLVNAGFDVYYYALNGDNLSKNAVCLTSAQEAANHAEIILCPVPMTKDGINILHTTDDDCKISSLLACLDKSHTLIAGTLPKDVSDFCEKEQIKAFSLANRDDFALLNAVATAEGTIAKAISLSNINLHASECLVMGYGRCAKVLAAKLAALSARVTVAVRRADAAAEAFSAGFNTVYFNDLPRILARFNFIFNTVPALVLDKNALLFVKKSTVLIDIASAPGGIDFDEANKLNLNASLQLGLPGIYAPKTSGEIIAATVQNIINESGDF